MRDMHRRTKVTVELLNLGKGEGISQRGELGLRKTLCHKAQECRRFGKRAAFGYQCGNAPFGVYREVFGAPLALETKIDQNRLVRRASLFERDVRRKRTRTWGVIKSEHVVRPSIDHGQRSAHGSFARHLAGGGRVVSPCDVIRVKLRITAGLPPDRYWIRQVQAVVAALRSGNLGLTRPQKFPWTLRFRDPQAGVTTAGRR